MALPKGAVKGYSDVPTDERSLMSAVSQQPVSVAVHGARGTTTPSSFYRGGVLRSDCAARRSPYGPGPDHGVLLVGYGVTANGSK